MTARVSQTSLKVLAEKESQARVNQVSVLVLWGISATARVNQVSLNVLARRPVRRTVAITD